MSYASKLFPKSNSTRAGGARTPKTVPSATLAELIAADPCMAAMFAGASWADVLEGACAPSSTGRATFSEAYIQAEREAIAAAETAEEAAIWQQPFSRNLEARFADRLDLSALAPEEEAACMTWLYANGWHASGPRDFLEAYPADLPPRVWVAPAVDRFAGLLEAEVTPHAVASALSQPAKKKGATVPRFCRTAACADAGCRYVHADTMARLDKPCGFGSSCGASDATGVKRSQCLYMHPGETWSATLVVTRPAPAPAPAAPACECAGGCPH